MALVEAVRLVVPVALSALAAGWLLSRRMPGADAAQAPLPPWRPWPALAFQLAAFAGTAALAWRLMGPGAPPPGTAALAGFLLCAGATALLALASAVPLGWLAERLARRWQAPLLALVVGVAAWRAAAAVEALWGLFSDATLSAVAVLLQVLPGEVTLQPAERVVGLGEFVVRVAPVCSGVDGVGLVLIFLATWIALARSRLHAGRALLLLPLGAAAALGANVVRIAALIWVGSTGHEDLAMGGLHSKLGWLLFLGMALGGIALAERAPWLSRASPDEGGPDVPEAAGAYLGPLLAALGAALVTGLASPGPFDAWYGLRVAAPLAVLWALRRHLPAPRLDLSGAPVPLLLGLATCAVWLAWPAGDGAPLAEALGRLGTPARVAWLAVRVAGAVLVIPLVEELAFRGFLLPWLVSPEFESVPARAWTASAVLLSSLAFGALHDRWFLGALAGLAFAAARLWRGRLSDAVLAHAVCNAGLAAAALWGGRLDLWA